jgi:hypothetical protein
LLDKALTPCLDQISFNFDEKIVDSIIPPPENIPFILKNEPFTTYIFFNEGVQLNEIATSIKLKCFDSKLN